MKKEPHERQRECEIYVVRPERRGRFLSQKEKYNNSRNLLGILTFATREKRKGKLL